jgi:hypothetical protein
VKEDNRRPPGRRGSRLDDVEPQPVDGNEQIVLRRRNLSDRVGKPKRLRDDWKSDKDRGKYQPAHGGHYV